MNQSRRRPKCSPPREIEIEDVADTAQVIALTMPKKGDGDHPVSPFNCDGGSTFFIPSHVHQESHNTLRLKPTESTAAESEAATADLQIIEDRDSLDYFFENADSDSSREVNLDSAEKPRKWRSKMHVETGDDSSNNNNNNAVNHYAHPSPIMHLMMVSEATKAKSRTSSSAATETVKVETTKSSEKVADPMLSLVDCASSTLDSEEDATSHHDATYISNSVVGGTNYSLADKETVVATNTTVRKSRVEDLPLPSSGSLGSLLSSNEETQEEQTTSKYDTPIKAPFKTIDRPRSGLFDPDKDVLSYVVDHVMRTGGSSVMEQEALEEAIETASSMPDSMSHSSSSLKLQDEIIPTLSGSPQDLELGMPEQKNKAQSWDVEGQQRRRLATPPRPAFFVHSDDDMSPMPPPVVTPKDMIHPSLPYKQDDDMTSIISTTENTRLKQARQKMRDIEHFVKVQIPVNSMVSTSPSNESAALRSPASQVDAENETTPQVTIRDGGFFHGRTPRGRDWQHTVGMGLLVFAGSAFIILLIIALVWLF